MKKLMLLHYKADYNTNDIWKEAIKRGFSTERVSGYVLSDIIKNYDYVRYYGNTLQAEQLGNVFPFKFHKIDPSILASSDYAGRKVRLMKFSELSRPRVESLFIKPVYQKFFTAKIYAPDDELDGTPLEDDLIYVQDVVDIRDEIRCFCLNGEIRTASYYRINKEFEQVNADNIVNKIGLQYIVKNLYENFKLPPGVVLDFGLTNKGQWIFIEPNEAWASGMYYCDPDKCFDVILESQF
jgi:hypothetical protein